MTNSPIIILDHPQLGDNIGMAARAMANCGLSRLRLVCPRDGWPNPKALQAAAGANDIIEQAECFDDLASAIKDIDLLLATTARPRSMDIKAYPPWDAMTRIEAHYASNQNANIAILFGGERSGLDNDAVASAHAVLYFPLSPDFKSLNLSHAVLLFSWEWLRFYENKVAQNAQTFNFSPHEDPIANLGEIDNLLARLSVGLEAGGFFHNPDMKPTIFRSIKKIFTKANLSRQEVQTFHGMIRALRNAAPLKDVTINKDMQA
ncbi:MAG: RNA methyltransferase [Alphaproteobacteria bacterium]